MPWRLKVKDRALEWLLASYTVVFGAWLAQSATAFNATALARLLAVIPESTWAMAFSIIGTIHCVALAINGAGWWTPYVRTAAASFNLIAYALLAVGIYVASPDSSGVPTYGFLVPVGLGVVVHRAARDVFLSRGVRRHGH